MLLVGVTAAVAIALLVVGVQSVLGAAGKPGTAAAAPSGSGSPVVPRAEPGPTPRGLPPRPTPTHVATAPAQPIASLAPGACLQTYDSKWAPAYPVVDCSAPHIAQLIAAGTLPQSASAAFPGTGALDTQVGDLCTPSLNWHWVAVWNEDVQLDLRYPDTAEKWATGDRAYYCIVYTFSRHELTGSARVEP
ncbi:hypothetical protein DOE76_07085 [Leifsonia sp. ku-ls]|nr:hypothetical protein DOE76_07085 [Leifsonia sp. ku-ls]